MVVVEQVVTPLDRRPQRLLADVGGRADLVQEGETVVQAGEDGGRRQHLDPGCGELDRQREPVEHPADVGDVGGVRLVDLESRAGGASPVAEQADRLRILDLLATTRPDWGRPSGGTGQATSPATASGWRLVARMVSARQSRSSRRAAVAQASTRCSHVSSTSRPGRSPIPTASASNGSASAATPTAPAISYGTTRASLTSARLDEPHRPFCAASAWATARARPGLAGPARPGQRHDAVVREHLVDPLELLLPADQP